MNSGAQNQDENESKCSISHMPSSFSAKELSHTTLKSCNMWTEPNAEIPRDLAEAADRSDRSIFVEKYNILAYKYSLRLMFTYTFKSSTDNLNVASTRRHSWFSRKILKRQSSTENIRDKADRYLRHKRSFSELSFIFKSRKDKLKGKNLQELSRLCGVSILYLPSEFTVGNLLMPTCFRATAQYLAQYGTTTRGIFYIPGSQDSVDDLYNHFCYPNEHLEVVSGTVRSPSLPDHIKYDVYDVASAFKRFLIGLPGGILGSLTLFDAFVSIRTQLDVDPQVTGTKISSVRARLIALAILTSSSQYRRSLICAVFGLLCMVGHAAESKKRGDEKERSLLTSDLMGYSSLGVIFGPILAGDLLEDYSMQLASPREGIVLLPMSPTKSRKERKVCSSKNLHKPKAYNDIDKNEICSSVAEMLITQWRDVVKHLKDLSPLDDSGCIQKSNSCCRKHPILRPCMSEYFTLKGAPEKTRSPVSIFRRNFPIITPGSVTPEESESNDEGALIKQHTTSNSPSKQGLPSSKSLSVLSPTLEENSTQKTHSPAREKPQELLLSSSPVASCQADNQDLEFKYHHRIREPEISLYPDNKCKSRHSKIPITPPVFFEKTESGFSRSSSTSDGIKSHTKSDDMVRKAVNSSKSKNFERALRRNSSTSSIKFPVLEMKIRNQEDRYKRESPSNPYGQSIIPLHAISRSFEEASPRKSHCFRGSNPDIKTLIKNCDPQIISCSLCNDPNYNSVFARVTNYLANNYKSRLNIEDLVLPRNPAEATDSSFYREKNARYRDDFDINEVGLNISSSQNKKNFLTKSLSLTNNINGKILFSDSTSRSTSHRSDKMLDLLAKFENNVSGSTAVPKKSNSFSTRSYSAFSRERPLSVYTQNSTSPTKSRMSTKPVMKPKTSLGTFSMDNGSIINFETSHMSSFKPNRCPCERAIEKRPGTKMNKSKKNLPSLSVHSDATLSPLLNIKGFGEILNTSSPKSFPTVARSLSATRLHNTEVLSSSLISPNIGNKSHQSLTQSFSLPNKLTLNMQTRLRKKLNKTSPLSYQSQDSPSQISTDPFNHDSGFIERTGENYRANFVSTTTSCTPNHMLFDQVRNLQRKLDKKNDEVCKLKQKLSTQEDIVIGSLTQELLDSKKLAQYWQERAEIFEKSLHLLSQTLSENKISRFPNKYGVSLMDSDMSVPKTREAAQRSLSPYLVDNHSRTGSLSAYSSRTVIREPQNNIALNNQS